MLIHFIFFFMLVGFTNIMLIVITADTKGLKPQYASKARALNTLCVEYIGPVIALMALILIPTVIIWGV